MKEVYITIEVKELFYEAFDGTTFKDKKECEKYEVSAECTLLTKYSPLIVKKTNEWELYNSGSDEETVHVVKLKSKEDIDTLIQLYFHYNGKSERTEKNAISMLKSCKKALETDDFLIIYRGYCDDNSHFYIRGTVTETYEHMIKLCKNETN